MPLAAAREISSAQMAGVYEYVYLVSDLAPHLTSGVTHVADHVVSPDVFRVGVRRGIFDTIRAGRSKRRGRARWLGRRSRRPSGRGRRSDRGRGGRWAR